MADTKTALAQLGWRVDTPARLAQAIEDFQRMWNLGPALAVDGNDGPATRAALQVSLDRRATRLPDISDNFSALEFACACGGRNAACRRIWAHRALVQACENYRTLTGPLSIVRGCRCPVQNKAVGGATNSQHLYGTGVDVDLYAITPATLAAKRFVSGIGRYSWQGKNYVRHLDVRHVWGNDPRNTTDSTTASPAQWSYGVAKSAPLTPQPGTSRPAPAAPVTSEEDDMTDPAVIAQLARIEKRVDYISAQVKATAQLVVDKDADNLTASDIADLVPDTLAQQVVDALSARLSKPNPQES